MRGKRHDICQLVNPLCPTDLCTLLNGHRGTRRRQHLLTSMGSTPHTVSPHMFLYLGKPALDQPGLVALGWKRQAELMEQGKL